MTMLTDRAAYIEGLKRFVSASPSSFHAAHEAARQLTAAGFTALDEGEAWPALVAGQRAFVVRDGAIIAWVAGDSLTPHSRVNILGAHTDSPGFMLKPQATFVTEGYVQAGVEIYGGPLVNSWLDRDLEFAGRLVTRDGREHLARTGPIARIPQLAIHLDRAVNEGLELQRQRHTQPIIAVGVDGAVADPLSVLAKNAGLAIEDIAGYDIVTADTQAPELIGAKSDLLASGRLDNLSSTYAGLVALLHATPAPGSIAMLASFDHEEVGSSSRSGASGPMLEEILSRLYASLGATAADRARGFAQSWCLSADAGHAVHPNYTERHDPNVRPLLGQGPVLKINAIQRYATDALGKALWADCCEREGQSTQPFVSHNDVPCGSTIGPLTATRLGIRTLDAGVPLLSMHSARELAHTSDLHALARITASFFER